MPDFAFLAAQYGTPFYILDFASLKSRVSNIKSRLPQNATLCYAIKANAFLVEPLKDEDILFEVCSPGELSICEKAGLSPQKIVFSGVCKTLNDVRRAYSLKVHTITLESKAHCDYLIQTISESKNPHGQHVILRLSGGNQFGMSAADIEECVRKLHEIPTVHIRGIHFFTGTQKRAKDIEKEIPFIEQFCDELKQKFPHALSGNLEIEYGAGLPYDYFSGNDEKGNFSALDAFANLIKNSSRQYVIELGRYVASPCARYATKIMDVKDDDKSRYCIIDGGINHINYYGQMMGMRTPKVEHIRQAEPLPPAGEDALPHTIAGSLCTTADIVLRQLPLAAPAIGDLLVFKDIGAYSITEGIYLFLSHPLPAVLGYDGEKTSVLRKATETYILNS